MEQTRETEFKHVSVLLKEAVDGLAVLPDGIYADGTMGGAGHGYEICKRLSTAGRYIGIDRDEDAICAGQKRLLPFADRVTIVRDSYSHMKQIVEDLGIRALDGILLDLGVSSYQLDTPERGFSYMQDAPLDMRMDKRQEKTARDLVNESTERELFFMIRDFGEEPFAQNIAKHIVAKRTEKPINTTLELVEVIRAAIPMRVQKTLGHPAKRTFQAIRIALNSELEELSNALEDMTTLLSPGGRFAVITFHSLEDRIVKSYFKREENPCICPPEFPVCVCNKVPRGTVITKKPILPTAEEQEENKRAKSAKLRIFEKTSR